MPQPMYVIPDKWTQVPEIQDKFRKFFDTIDSHSEDAERAKLWKRFMLEMHASYADLATQDQAPLVAFDNPDVAERATAQVQLYFQTESGKEEAIEIDGAKLGLLRRPERFSGPLSELKLLQDLVIIKDTNRFWHVLDLLHKADADNIIEMIRNLHSKLTHIRIRDVQEFTERIPEAGVDLAEEPLASPQVSFPNLSVSRPTNELPTPTYDCLVRAVIDTFKTSWDTVMPTPLTHSAFDGIL